MKLIIQPSSILLILSLFCKIESKAILQDENQLIMRWLADADKLHVDTSQIQINNVNDSKNDTNTNKNSNNKSNATENQDNNHPAIENYIPPNQWSKDQQNTFFNIFKMKLLSKVENLKLLKSFQLKPLDSQLQLAASILEKENQLETLKTNNNYQLETFNHQKEYDTNPCKDIPNTFYFKSENRCMPELTCDAIYNDILVNPKVLANGLGKQIRLGKYVYKGNNHQMQEATVAYIETKQNKKGTLVREAVSDRVVAGLDNLMAFQGHKSVLEVYGSCTEEIEQTIPGTRGSPPITTTANRTIFISEFCEHGDLSNFVSSETYKNFNMIQRIELAISFLKTFKFLHNSPSGTRINCDMNGLHRALTQFLVTEDFTVVLNDLDDIPVVTNDADNPSKCDWGVFNILNKEENAHLKLDESFLAPEQIMSEQQYLSYYPKERVHYHTEKIDIWKLPDMLMFILTKSVNSLSTSIDVTRVLMSIENLLKQCKSINYHHRPTAEQLVNKLRAVLLAIKLEKNLEVEPELTGILPDPEMLENIKTTKEATLESMDLLAKSIVGKKANVIEQ